MQNNHHRRRQAHILGQQQEQAEAAVRQLVGNLAMSIYQRAASQHIAAGGGADREMLRQWAKDAIEAAQAYFEGIGVAEFDAP